MAESWNKRDDGSAKTVVFIIAFTSAFIRVASFSFAGSSMCCPRRQAYTSKMLQLVHSSPRKCTNTLHLIFHHAQIGRLLYSWWICHLSVQRRLC